MDIKYYFFIVNNVNNINFIITYLNSYFLFIIFISATPFLFFWNF